MRLWDVLTRLTTKTVTSISFLVTTEKDGLQPSATAEGAALEDNNDVARQRVKAMQQ